MAPPARITATGAQPPVAALIGRTADLRLDRSHEEDKIWQGLSGGARPEVARSPGPPPRPPPGRDPAAQRAGLSDECRRSRRGHVAPAQLSWPLFGVVPLMR
jgi:hypothetical protein